MLHNTSLLKRRGSLLIPDSIVSKALRGDHEARAALNALHAEMLITHLESSFEHGPGTFLKAFGYSYHFAEVPDEVCAPAYRATFHRSHLGPVVTIDVVFTPENDS